MRIFEIAGRKYVYKNVHLSMPDGILSITDHFEDRCRDRNFPAGLVLSKLIDILQTAVDHSEDEILAAHDERITLVLNNGYKIGIIKSEDPSNPGFYDYKMTTVLDRTQTPPVRTKIIHVPIQY